MVHSGYEASGVNYTFGSFKGLMQTAKAIFFSEYKDEGAQDLLNKWESSSHGPLVQIGNGPTPVVVTTSVNENMSVAGD
jgi:hypothetical protein